LGCFCKNIAKNSAFERLLILKPLKYLDEKILYYFDVKCLLTQFFETLSAIK
tara:strand:- start:308 stop:463 length:156 start_codon:yes stop_codon:yes gene_type:complete